MTDAHNFIPLRPQSRASAARVGGSLLTIGVPGWRTAPLVPDYRGVTR